MVSLIIPTLNAARTIRDLLGKVRAQTVPCEIVVVDSSSDDDTVRFARFYEAKTVVIPRGDFNHGGTRNLGVNYSTGEWLLFMTQDAMPADDRCFSRLLEPLADKTVVASYARQIARNDASPPEQFARLRNYPENPAIRGMESWKELGIEAFFFSNVCSAVKKREFLDLGGFPENVEMFEDMLFAARAMERGFKVAYAAAAQVVHSHNYTWPVQFHRYYLAGRTFGMNDWFHPYQRSSGRGACFLRAQVQYLAGLKAYQWVCYAVIEALFKFAGFRLGMVRGRLGRRLPGSGL